MEKDTKIIFGVVGVLLLAIVSFNFLNNGVTGNVVASLVTCNPGQKIGDLNGDGLILQMDKNLMVGIATGAISLPTNLCCVDLNNDIKVNSIDVQRELNIINGLSSSPGSCPGRTSATVSTNLTTNVKANSCDADSSCEVTKIDVVNPYYPAYGGPEKMIISYSGIFRDPFYGSPSINFIDGKNSTNLAYSRPSLIILSSQSLIIGALNASAPNTNSFGSRAYVCVSYDGVLSRSTTPCV